MTSGALKLSKRGLAMKFVAKTSLLALAVTASWAAFANTGGIQYVPTNKPLEYVATAVKVQSDGRVCFDMKSTTEPSSGPTIVNVMTTCSPDSVSRTDIEQINARLDESLKTHPAWLWDQAFLKSHSRSHTGGYIFSANEVVSYLDGLKNKVACSAAGETYRDAKEKDSDQIEALKRACL